MNQIEKFIHNFEKQSFPHDSELIPELKKGKCECIEVSKKYSSSDLLNIYKVRKEHLKKFNTSHSNKMHEEVAKLCSYLSQKQNKKCEVWVFNVAPNKIYSVFINPSKKEVVTCILGFDENKTTPKEWSALWGATNTDPKDS